MVFDFLFMTSQFPILGAMHPLISIDVANADCFLCWLFDLHAKVDIAIYVITECKEHVHLYYLQGGKYGNMLDRFNLRSIQKKLL